MEKQVGPLTPEGTIHRSHNPLGSDMQTQEEEVGDGKRHSSRDPQNFPLSSKVVDGQAAGELSWREALKLAQM